MATLEVAIDARKAKQGASEFVSAQDSMRRAAEKMVAAQKESYAKLANLTNVVRGSVGDLGDAVGMLGNDFLGLSKSQQKALEGTLAMTQKGAALGSIFGPLGGVIGGAAGALLGYASASREAAKETLALAKAEREKRAAQLGGAANTLQSIALSAGVDVFGLGGKTMAQLEAERVKLQGIIKTEGEFALDASQKFEALSSAQNANTKDVESAKSAVNIYSKSLAERSLKLAEVEKALKSLSEEEERFAGVTEVVAGPVAKDPKDPKSPKGTAAKSALELANDAFFKEAEANVKKFLADKAKLEEDAAQEALDKRIQEAKEQAAASYEAYFETFLGETKLAEKAEENSPITAWMDQYDSLMDAQKNFESIMVGSFDTIANSMAQSLFGMDVDWAQTMKSMGVELTALLLKMLAAAALKSVITGATGGVGGIGAALGSGVIGDLIVGGSFHSGGTAGPGGGSPMVAPASMFKGAPRFHGGLAPDEFPAILQTGEQVLSRQQVANGGGGRTVNITNYFPDVRDSRGFNRSIDQNADRMRRMLRDD